MPFAIQVREDNIDMLMEFGKERKFNLDYLKDNMEYNAEFGWNSYLITDGNEENDNRTFTMSSDAGFFADWKFAEPEDPTKFVKIERV